MPVGGRRSAGLPSQVREREGGPGGRVARTDLSINQRWQVTWGTFPTGISAGRFQMGDGGVNISQADVKKGQKKIDRMINYASRTFGCFTRSQGSSEVVASWCQR